MSHVINLFILFFGHKRMTNQLSITGGKRKNISCFSPRVVVTTDPGSFELVACTQARKTMKRMPTRRQNR